MIKTKITELLSIKYPVLMGGMQWLSTAEFVSAVSEAGGLGFITAASFKCPGKLREEIRKCRSMTDKPFGINVSMLPDVTLGELTEQYLNVALEENITVIETSGRKPDAIISKVKPAGIKIIHKVTSAKHAISAQKAGVDAIILVGYEAGGHPGMNQVGTFVNLPATVNAVDIPVIAAGGVCDSKSLVAALALGAEGIMMGTRFMLTKESIVHQNIKDWMIQASETDTIITQRSINNAFRSIKNAQTYKILGMEESGVQLKDLLHHISGQRNRVAWETGDLDNASLSMGQCVGLIEDIPSVKELLDRMFADAESVIGRLQNIYKI